MVNSISSLIDGAESCSLKVWQDYCESGTREKIAKIQLLRDPLKNCSFRSEQVLTVFGFYLGENECSMVYFWDRHQQAANWSRLESMRETKSFLEFGMMISSLHERNPTLKSILGFLSDEIESDRPELLSLLEGLNVYWANFGDMKFACVYVDTRTNGRVEHTSSIALLECLSFHHDYFKIRSPVWNAVPMRFLFSEFGSNADFFERVLLHPKSFDPTQKVCDSSFLWPWQRCIARKNACNEIAYNTINTTSLVFDLRKSTIAMEQLRRSEIGEYSPFINETVRTAKEIIFKHGGFFDKETGDGTVGHFIEFSSSEDFQVQASANRRAFDAAVEIVRTISKICENFQSRLKLGVGELGASVGIHTGDAVWISEMNQVRAIGESVILAARLCNEAPARSVFVSNTEFGELAKTEGAEISSLFEKYSYSGKEVKNGADLFGFKLTVSDNF